MTRLGLLALLLAATACSSATATPAASSDAGATDDAILAAAPYASVVTDTGLHVDVRTDPQPPPRGTFNVILDIKDGAGNPVDGLTIDAVPWMPAMGHGSSIRTNVSAEGGGRYAIGNVGMFMPGDWELRLTMSGGASAHATPIIPIP
jgi:hypothetical protein